MKYGSISLTDCASFAVPWLCRGGGGGGGGRTLTVCAPVLAAGVESVAVAIAMETPIPVGVLQSCSHVSMPKGLGLGFRIYGSMSAAMPQIMPQDPNGCHPSQQSAQTCRHCKLV
jgi:hypothetical protein